MLVYDEHELVSRLSRLDRASKTAFAAACAECLLPLVAQYSPHSRGRASSDRLATIVNYAWLAAAGSSVLPDVSVLQTEAESMVPADGEGWTAGMGFGQNAAAAAAYAVRTWRTDNPQEAGWAARQVYEAADYAALQANEKLDLNSPAAASLLQASDLVQSSLRFITGSLARVELGAQSWDELRAEASAEGRRLARAAWPDEEV